MSNEGPSQRGAEFQLQPVPASKRKKSTANNERPRLWPAPAPTLLPAPRMAAVRPSRLRRSLSVPNLKAMCTTDLNATARHSIPMPARLAHGGGGGSSASSGSLKGWSAVRPVRNYVERNSNAADPSSSTRTPPPWLSSVAKPIARLCVRSVRPSAIGPSTASTFAHVPAQATVVTPSHLPPINSQTLRELDLHEILKNPQLRHDLVFDADLQFRPNFDGERGRRKRDLNNKYWRAVQREIQTQCSCTSFYGNVELPCACASYRRRRGSGPMFEVADTINKLAPDARFFARIPVLIAELRYICMSVLPPGTAATGSLSTCSAWPISSTSSSMPESATSPSTAKNPDASATTKSAAPSTTTNPTTSTSPTTQFSHAATSIVSSSMMGDEHALIAQCLDPVLIMQQLHYGVLDVVGLISTLGAILKQHCAPMRDPLIDSMVSTVMQHGDVTRSLRQCFEILELMKLDVANHQLSTSRIYLVETAAEFELRWLREQMTKGRMTLHRTVSWFSQHLTQQTKSFNCPSTRSATITAAFDEGLMDLIFDPPSQATPQMAFAANLPSPSKFCSFSGLGPQNLASLAYPETFQFDAHRLLTFHGEVTDLTVVSMLLLLFRQLACSQQNLSQDPLPVLPTSTSSKSIAAKASAIASAQLAKVKNEIWTLLREAEAELSSCNNSNSQTVTNSPGGPTTPGGVAGRVLDSRLSSWRKVISDLVLQIAARAIQVQRMARATETSNEENPGAECNVTIHRPPTQATITLLTRWLETNLASGSALFTLCRTRLRDNLSKLSKSEDCSSSRSSAAWTTLRSVGRKRALSTLASDNFAAATSSKRCKTDNADAINVCSASKLSQSSRCDDEDSNKDDSPPRQQENLEPFTAEIGLLAERIKKVKSFHLTVYRPFYECMAASQQDCAGGDAATSSASSPSTTSTNVSTTSSA